jgi:CRP-like cAMP-binding protein
MDALLRSAPLFAELDAETVEALSGRLAETHVPRGKHLFEEGDPGDALHVVVDGKIKICRNAGDGRENVVAILGPGDLLGELSIFDDSHPRGASAVAVVDCTLATLAKQDFRAWLAEHPAVAVELLRALAARLRQTNEQMADLVFTDVPGRIAKTLLNLAERFGRPDGDAIRVEHDLTQEELAQLVGASRETVNKALADFAGRGWIRLDGRAVVLLETERLARRAR